MEREADTSRLENEHEFTVIRGFCLLLLILLELAIEGFASDPE